MGLRMKKGDMAAGGVAECSVAMAGWGTAEGGEQSGEGGEVERWKLEAGSGRQSGKP